MEIKSKDLEEALGVTWHLREQGIKEEKKIVEILQEGIEKLEHHSSGEVLEELIKQDLVRLEKEKIEFTKKGEEIAQMITRRHRLAERLLNDVLEVKKEEIDKSACEFEHILSLEVTDSICTLLGHPKLCPHGSPIPEGECCRKAKEEIEPLVVSLDKLSFGERGKILYLNIPEHGQLHKLLSLGIIPGKIVHLHQTYPAYVLRVEETQIALEEAIAKNIYLRKI